MKSIDEYFKDRARELTKKEALLKEQQKKLLEEVEEMYEDFLIENSLDKEVIRKKYSDLVYIYPRMDCDINNIIMVYIPINYDGHERLAVSESDSNDYTEVLKEIKENYAPAFE